MTSLHDIIYPDATTKTEIFNITKRVSGFRYKHAILLYGPPGTGKTTLAEAISKELLSQYENTHRVQSFLNLCEIKEDLDPKTDFPAMVKTMTNHVELYDFTPIILNEVDALSSNNQQALANFID